MTRSILIVIAVGAFVSVVAGSGCQSGGVGDPCVPDQEYNSCFPGFQVGEVNTESKSFQCQTRLCLVNHFQGRVSCPYGQTAGTTDLSATCGVGVVGGAPITPYYPTTDYPSGTTPTTCTIPGGATVLAGQSAAVQEQFQVQVAVPPQVFERNTASAVYCSCRCANPDGQTNDGSVYCTCPDNYTCTQLVSSIGGATEGQLVGGYCMLNGTGYKASQSSDCTVSGTCCNPSTANAVCGMNGNEACTCP